MVTPKRRTLFVTTLFVTLLSSPAIIHPATSALFDLCSSSVDCFDRNQLCEKFSFVAPTCSRGLCQCKPCHVIDVDGCQRARYLNFLDQSCQMGRRSEIVTVPRAECVDGRVQCVASKRLKDRCVAFKECDDDLNFKNQSAVVSLAIPRSCSPGMVCHGNRCMCPEPWQRFDATRQKCVERRHGDICSRHEDCEVRSRVNRAWSNLMTCDRMLGRCSCRKGTKVSQWSGIDPERNVFVTMTTCFKATIATNIYKGTCFNNPVSDNNNDRTRICAPGFSCVICPENGSLTGECRLINHAQVISNQQCGAKELQMSTFDDEAYPQLNNAPATMSWWPPHRLCWLLLLNLVMLFAVDGLASIHVVHSSSFA